MSDLAQRSPEWFEARRGRVTGSEVANVLMGKGTAGYRNYRATKVLERLGAPFEEHYVSKEMQRGIDVEPVARLRYMLETRSSVAEEGFVIHPTLMAGVSPDGLVGRDGLIEIKCRNTANHIDTLKSRAIPKTYVPQVQMQLWITGRTWCDYVSYDDRVPVADAQFIVVRVERNEDYIKTLIEKIISFLDDVDAEVEFVQNYKKGGNNEPSSKTVTASDLLVRTEKNDVPKAPAKQRIKK